MTITINFQEQNIEHIWIPSNVEPSQHIHAGELQEWVQALFDAVQARNRSISDHMQILKIIGSYSIIQFEDIYNNPMFELLKGTKRIVISTKQ